MILEASGLASCITVAIFLISERALLEQREQINRNALSEINPLLRLNPVEALSKELLSYGARFSHSTAGFALRSCACNCFAIT
jgi:hypothetical protein